MNTTSMIQKTEIFGNRKYIFPEGRDALSIAAPSCCLHCACAGSIDCKLCLYNIENGFTFKNRGFGMQVVLPEENRQKVSEELVKLCPTGALYNE